MKAGSLLAACAPPMPKGGSTIGLSATDAPYGFAAGDGLLYATVLRSRGQNQKTTIAALSISVVPIVPQAARILARAPFA